ncbi:uncharacterized protein LOC128988412 [Macrosteles quadrilineatus]|uniref:uncharacterized protein LOC128988412 n=1 Tax=Macrosteles quadrilineatus TaxID=74068 RepID=UPI0023E3010E|nr:uncharacterized protein LOC128988412 [Macrosteles quadrilineatus]
MAAFVVLLILSTSILMTLECKGKKTALASNPDVVRTYSTSLAQCEIAAAHRAEADDQWLMMFSKMVKDGVDVGHTLLQVFQWPLEVGLSLHNAVLSQIGAMISWFNFLVGFVSPGGTGTALLSWLRGDPTKMS